MSALSDAVAAAIIKHDSSTLLEGNFDFWIREFIYT